jgi:hypothetical protein
MQEAFTDLRTAHFGVAGVLSYKKTRSSGNFSIGQYDFFEKKCFDQAYVFKGF